MSVSTSRLPRVEHICAVPQQTPRITAAASASDRQLRIGVFGLFGSGNLGNDGSLESLLAFLRSARPNALVHVICQGEGVVQAHFGLPTVPIKPPAPASSWFRLTNNVSLRSLARFRELIHAVNAARQFDVILVPGTGILDDFGERWRDMPYWLFRWTLAARLAGTPFAFLSIGAGPIRNPVSRWLMRSAAALARFRSYRDRYSKHYMAGIGLVRPGDAVTPDIGFRLPPPKPARRSKTGRPVIGVGLMGYAGWKHAQADAEAIYRAYISKMAEFARWLIERGYAVRLIVGDNGDARAVNEVLALLARDKSVSRAEVVADPAASLSEIMDQIAQTELLVATRFHNLVCGLMAGKPVMSVGYAKKNDVLLADMGLGAFCQHIERLDVDRLKAQFEDLMRDRQNYLPGIAERAALYREQLAEQEKRLLAELL